MKTDVEITTTDADLSREEEVNRIRKRLLFALVLIACVFATGAAVIRWLTAGQAFDPNVTALSSSDLAALMNLVESNDSWNSRTRSRFNFIWILGFSFSLTLAQLIKLLPSALDERGDGISSDKSESTLQKSKGVSSAKSELGELRERQRPGAFIFLGLFLFLEIGALLLLWLSSMGKSGSRKVQIYEIFISADFSAGWIAGVKVESLSYVLLCLLFLLSILLFMTILKKRIGPNGPGKIVEKQKLEFFRKSVFVLFALWIILPLVSLDVGHHFFASGHFFDYEPDAAMVRAFIGEVNRNIWQTRALNFGFYCLIAVLAVFWWTLYRLMIVMEGRQARPESAQDK